MQNYKNSALPLNEFIMLFLEHDSAHLPFCVYIKSGALLCLESNLYLSDYPEIGDDDTESYPQFVIENDLEIFCHGDQFEDIVKHVAQHVKHKTLEHYIKAIDFYMQHDNFYDF